jgi:alkylated DNA repair protein alkB family protein 6
VKLSSKRYHTINANIKPPSYQPQIPPNRWTQLSHRRLQAHPSTLTNSNTLIAAPLPPWLTKFPPILERFEALGVFSGTKHGGPNHVLVNEYKAGEGIMRHEDGAAYEPVVATVSLGGSVCLELWDKDLESAEDGSALGKSARWRILQEPGSLLVTKGEAYGCLLHGISDIAKDEGLSEETVINWSLLGSSEKFTDGVNERTTRISLTYRDVTKVSTIGMGILGRK